MTEGNVLRLRQVSSRAAMQELHDRMVRQFNNGKREVRATALAKKHGCTLSPLSRIEPLFSWLELLEDGVYAALRGQLRRLCYKVPCGRFGRHTE